MKLLVIDNYDSFTYNLVHIIEGILHQQVRVAFNDAISLDEVEQYDAIVLSPGPGIPSEAGITNQVINRYALSKKILGICLGHQAIGEAFGGQLVNLTTVYHGIATPVNVLPANEKKLFKNLPDVMEVGRYHSWVIDEKTFPQDLEITAVDDNGYIMALQHKTYDVQGVQFHPESVLTPQGEAILRNWLKG